VIPDDVRIVTYATRGMESMRGFDIFMKAAQRICSMRSDVMFLVVGQDKVCYGGDEKVIGTQTFKQWVLQQGDYDLSRFRFLGIIPPSELARLFSLTDAHVYLTVPFILSWSLMNALACGTTVVASATPPVREMIRHGHNGLLVDFFDVDGFARTICDVLDSPGDYAHLGKAGIEMVRDHYSLDVCLPQMLRLYQDALSACKPEPLLTAA
jgi:glycosyltransferase involved in cell wall biosynthesis